jgi:hypothetical protein
MSEPELERLRAEYARQTAEWNRLQERVADLPRDLRIAVPLPEEASDRRVVAAGGAPLPSGLRG